MSAHTLVRILLIVVQFTCIKPFALRDCKLLQSRRHALLRHPSLAPIRTARKSLTVRRADPAGVQDSHLKWMQGSEPPSQNLQDASLHDVHAQLDEILNSLWDSKIEVEGFRQPIPKSSNFSHIKHVVGGFSVVIRVPESGIAYRMQPMRSMKHGITWVAFYKMLEEVANDKVSIPSALRYPAIYKPDRTTIFEAGAGKKAWEDLEFVQDFQDERLRHATKRLVQHRRNVMKEGSLNYRSGRCTSASECEIESDEDGGTFTGVSIVNGIMFPSHWFWVKVGRPSEVSTDDGKSEGYRGQEEAHSHLSVVRQDDVKRIKGSELASALLLRKTQSKEKQDNPAPMAVDLKPVFTLVSVFPHAQGDVGGLCKKLWAKGAQDNVTTLVLQSVLRGLRRLHAIGVPHGDLKAANVLYASGRFCLTDLPALNWSATPVLTKDPVAQTMIRGKRLLCNDMWGLGFIGLSLVCGCERMEAVKSNLRQIDPLDYSSTSSVSRKLDGVTQNWLVTILLLLSSLKGRGLSLSPICVNVSEAAKKALTSSWIRRNVPAVQNPSYREECAFNADLLAERVFTQDRSTSLLESLCYCLDVTDVARNALAMPWPVEDA
mmetsp:Transcript_23164/g.52055  ORF Transcript_23164/g.52055 Transcript_23164/m.52055 type:complete len:603 (-) Transcript_23164:98-1906(-)